jgi:hypothetical protein
LLQTPFPALCSPLYKSPLQGTVITGGSQKKEKEKEKKSKRGAKGRDGRSGRSKENDKKKINGLRIWEVKFGDGF